MSACTGRPDCQCSPGELSHDRVMVLAALTVAGSLERSGRAPTGAEVELMAEAREILDGQLLETQRQRNTAEIMAQLAALPDRAAPAGSVPPGGRAAGPGGGIGAPARPDREARA